jgi:hypothetical protein
MTLATFRAQFPEFVNAPDTLVNAMLAAALLEIDTEIWAAKADQGQGYLAAHKLALSPFGNGTRLVINGKDTTYLAHYSALVGQVSKGGLLLGLGGF